VVAWSVLVVAGLLEVVWATLLKQADGFEHRGPLAAGIAVELVSVAMLAWTMQEISLGAGYAAWAGIGTIGTVIVGLILYREPLNARRVGFLALLVGGIVGLQLVEGG
jgi:quaternary ammonium compound-resistance protein SugE